MVKKLLVMGMGLAFVGLQAVGAFAAANPDTGPGCGLGKILWAEYKNQKNIMPQAFMATTNGIGSQTFAISTGTSGCTNDGVIWASERVHVFVAVNYPQLNQQMAQGQGEHLASLATLMGVPVEHQPAFFTLAQERYASLTQSDDSSPIAMIQALHDAMTTHPMLARASSNR